MAKEAPRDPNADLFYEIFAPTNEPANRNSEQKVIEKFFPPRCFFRVKKGQEPSYGAKALARGNETIRDACAHCGRLKRCKVSPLKPKAK